MKFLHFYHGIMNTPIQYITFFIPYNEICRSYLFNIKEFWECICPRHPYPCQEVECSPHSEEVPGLASQSSLPPHTLKEQPVLCFCHDGLVCRFQSIL